MTISDLNTFVKSAAPPGKGIEHDAADFSKFTPYDPPGPAWDRRVSVKRGLGRRVPREIYFSDTLSIKTSENTCKLLGHKHRSVLVNGIELCVVSAMLFLAAKKNYHWSSNLDLAIARILEVSKIES